MTEQEEQEVSARFWDNVEFIELLKKVRRDDAKTEAARLALIAEAKAENLAIIRQVLEGHPETFTMKPNGKWILSEREGPLN